MEGLDKVRQVRKRSGELIAYDKKRIVSAIYRAQQAVDKGNGLDIAAVAFRVEERLMTEYFNRNLVPGIEKIQDFVEKALMEFEFFDVATAYVRYRERRMQLRKQKIATLDVKQTIERYLGMEGGKRKDWRVKENANIGVDYPGLNSYVAGTHLAHYALSGLYPPEITRAHVAGQLHIHDLSNSIIAYCAGWSLQLLLEKGFAGVPGRVASRPAGHLDSAINQMVTFLGSLQNEFAGAQAFSSVDTLLSPFIRLKFVRSVEKILRQTFSLKANGYIYVLLDLLYAYRKDITTDEEIKQKLESLYPDVIFSKELLDSFLRSFEEEYEDNDSYVRQNVQNLIYALNQTSRWGGQAPFTNLSFDWIVPSDLAEQAAVVNGELHPRILYSDCQTEIDLFNRIFIEEMGKGDKDGRIFTFPIPTYSLTKDFDWDHPNVEPLMALTAKYGIPYFQNYSGTGIEPSSIRAMCCRLNLNLDELRKRPGGMWSIGDSTGSVGVVTINLNRVGYLAANEGHYFRLLRNYMELAKNSLEIKRKEINRHFKNGMMPYARVYLPHGFQTYFSTIGLCGMHESALNFLGKGIDTPEGLAMSVKVLKFMNAVCDEYKQETGNLYNLEATPAESTAYRFARLDKKWCPNIVTSGGDSNETVYLTNSTQLPVGFTDDLFEAIENQSKLQHLYTGGTIFHTFIGERIQTDACKLLVRLLAEKTNLPYFCITPTFSICSQHKYLKGQQPVCPQCGEVTEVFSRIVGYFRPISKWNAGKTKEFEDRKTYELDSENIKKRPLTVEKGLVPVIPKFEFGSEEKLPAKTSTDRSDYQVTLFVSPTCSRCKPFQKILKERIPREKVKTVDATVADGREMAEKYSVSSVPTVLIVEDGEEVDRFSTAKAMRESKKLAALLGEEM